MAAAHCREGSKPAGANPYLLGDAGSAEIMYIGQAAAIGRRLADHLQRPGDDKLLQFSYQVIGQSVLPHYLRDLEDDLIGNFYEHFRKSPAFQFQRRQ